MDTLDIRLEAVQALAARLHDRSCAPPGRAIAIPDWPSLPLYERALGVSAAIVAGKLAVGAVAASHLWTVAALVLGPPSRPTVLH